jgi:hypothetical protein
MWVVPSFYVSLCAPSEMFKPLPTVRLRASTELSRGPHDEARPTGIFSVNQPLSVPSTLLNRNAFAT